MQAKFFISAVFFLFILSPLKAQTTITDSAKVVNTLRELLITCRTVDFADPKVQKLGTFYKVAPYIIYRGEDEKRAWKDFANYNNPLEKKGVDEVCYRINSSVNQDSSYKILKYHTESESEGVWYAVQISYIKKGVEKRAIFAFLKIEDKFGLGDIDLY